ncbi:hypothetical protein [Nocardia brasiliensis]
MTNHATHLRINKPIDRNGQRRDHGPIPGPARTRRHAHTCTHPAELNGIRLLFGGTAGVEVAEVQVNETIAVAASQALGALDWPRLGQPRMPALSSSHIQTTWSGDHQVMVAASRE